MKITIAGAGYMGLVSGACFAEFGNEVTCVDRDQDKIARLKQGEVPIYEPGLDGLVANNMQAGRLHFDTELGPSMAKTDAVFITVGTPSRRGDGHPDLSYVFAATQDIANHLAPDTVIVTKSTVPVGTNRKIAQLIRGARPGMKFDVCANPEFMREGSAIQDFMRPDRVIIGGCESDRARMVMHALYRPLYLLETPIMFTNLETAELIKYASSAYLATKLALANQISDLCEQTGADTGEITLGLGLDSRIGRKFLQVGPGYGGSCLPKDVRAFVLAADQAGVRQHVVEEALKANETRKNSVARRVIEACGGEVTNKRIAILGLTYKANTDDVRDSVSLHVISDLREAGAIICAYDPEGMEEAKRILPDIEYANDAYGAMQDANAAVILTEWGDFRAMDLPRVKQALKDPVLVDLRNIYRPDEVRAAGISYTSLGRE